MEDGLVIEDTAVRAEELMVELVAVQPVLSSLDAGVIVGVENCSSTCSG